MMTTTSAARCAPAAHLTARRARVANGRAVTVTPSQKSSVVFRRQRLTATTVASATKTPHSYAHTNRKGLSAYVERAAAKQTKRDLIPFRVGMTLRVGVTVKEGNKTRVQPYEGVVIAIHRAGVATTVTVRKTSQGFGVERVFPVHSPLCTFEEIRGAGKPVVRRAKLFYLRGLVGKQARLKTRFVAKREGKTRHEIKMDALRAERAAEDAARAEAEAEAAAAEAKAAAEAEAAANAEGGEEESA